MKYFNKNHLAALALTVLCLTGIQNAFANEIPENAILQAMYNTGYSEGHKKGLEEGYAQGKREGLQEAQAQSQVRRVVRTTFECRYNPNSECRGDVIRIQNYSDNTRNEVTVYSDIKVNRCTAFDRENTCEGQADRNNRLSGR